MQTQVIGRQNDCEIYLQDQFVSRLHALLRFENGSYVVYDLGSSSGTFVNETRIDYRGKRLKNDDCIRIGKSVFIFEGTSKNESDYDGNQEIIAIDSNSNIDTKQLKNCNIHGPFAAALINCPICETLAQRRQ
jgi:pSer/pThr/pTyr-binding forkhead associated (FHA) protein